MEEVKEALGTELPEAIIDDSSIKLSSSIRRF